MFHTATYNRLFLFTFRFNSLNLRGRNKKTATDIKPAVLSPPLKPYLRDHPLTGPHKQHTVDLPLTAVNMSSDHPLSDSEFVRGEFDVIIRRCDAAIVDHTSSILRICV